MDERSVKLKFINEVTNENKLKNYEKRLQNIKKLMSSMTSNVKIGEEIKTIGNEAEKTDKKISSAFDKVKFAGFVIVLKKITSAMTEMINKSSSYLENINLYQVAFNGAYQEADRFVNKITEMYGLDESWAIKTVGIFRQLANAMGMATEQANELSYLMTQMSVDISSLYNVDISRASQVLQSALAGQTRPIRSVTGADITMNTLQQTLNQLGIDRAINSLSFAEKRMVIIISLVQQLQQATNDFGRTLESPSNQMRILNEQWQRLTRAVGNVFLPLLSKILPYLNAILMVLTEIINVVAALFGYKEEDYDYFSCMADSVLDLEEGLDGATESAKKLKQGLRGFDKLNVITTPTSTSASAGAGGISADILKAYDDAYKSYIKKLDNVQMKATKIRDTIMEWLGFTKLIDEKTGDISFKFDHITGGTVLGALGVGGVIFSGIKTIGSIFSKLTGLKFKNIASLFGKEGTLAKAFGSNGFITKFIVANPKLVAIVAIVTTLVAVFAKLYKENEEFREKVDNFFKLLKETFIPILEIFLEVWNELSSTLTDLIKGILKPLGELLTKTLKPIFEIILDLLSKLLKNVIQPLIEKLKPLVERILNLLVSVLEKIMPLIQKVIELVGNFLEKILIPLIKKLEPFISEVLEAIGDILINIILPILEKIIDAIDFLWKNILEPLMPFLEDVLGGILKGIGWTIENVVLKPFTTLIDTIQWLWDKIKGFANFWNDLKFDSKSVEGNFSGSAGMGGGGGGGRGFASGGLPPIGQMFIANERGPELVGQIGGQSFVANQNQMLGIIRDEIHSRTSGINNATIIVQVDSDEVARHTITNLEDISKANGKPFVIGG